MILIFNYCLIGIYYNKLFNLLFDFRVTLVFIFKIIRTIYNFLGNNYKLINELKNIYILCVVS